MHQEVFSVNYNKYIYKNQHIATTTLQRANMVSQKHVETTNFSNLRFKSYFLTWPMSFRSRGGGRDLIGQPPVNILCRSIAIKVVVRLKEKDNLVHYSHQSRFSRPSSIENFVTAPSETAKSVDIGIWDLNMFTNFVKNSNSMFDVALRM